jgi:hypothetical protein
VRLLADWAREELGLTRIDVLPNTGELVGAPRAGVEKPLYAVYVWRRTPS